MAYAGIIGDAHREEGLAASGCVEDRVDTLRSHHFLAPLTWKKEQRRRDARVGRDSSRY